VQAAVPGDNDLIVRVQPRCRACYNTSHNCLAVVYYVACGIARCEQTATHIGMPSLFVPPTSQVEAFNNTRQYY